MADRDRFGESDRDYAYTDYSGRQGLDVRNPADAAKQRHQFQYLDKGRSVVSDTEPAFTDFGHNRNFRFPQRTGTPNFRPPYGAPGQPSYNEWQQQIDPYADPYPPKQHPNPRMRGMAEGIGGLQEEASLPWRWYQKLINKFGEKKGLELWEQYASDDTGVGSTNEYQMAYSPGTYDDDEYGPFVPPSVIDMDLEGIDYDPADEYDFDRKRGYPGRTFGRGHKGPVYSARGGLMSLRR